MTSYLQARKYPFVDFLLVKSRAAMSVASEMIFFAGYSLSPARIANGYALFDSHPAHSGWSLNSSNRRSACSTAFFQLLGSPLRRPCRKNLLQLYEMDEACGYYNQRFRWNQ